jgi:hypothetical protein
LITNGPFRYCRNPIYLGNQLMFVGILLWIGQGFKSIFFSVPTFLFYSLITLYEENLLALQFGKTYENYKANTSRWLPKVAPDQITRSWKSRLPTGSIRNRQDGTGPHQDAAGSHQDAAASYQDSGATSIGTDNDGGGRFSWMRALQTERHTLLNSVRLFFMRRASIATRQRINK